MREITSKIKPNKTRKKILLISDVCGWAWWNKSQYLKAYLSKQFDIDVVCIIGPEATGRINQNRYDLYVTYGYSYMHYIGHIGQKRKRVTGITAHRPAHVLRPYMRMAGHVHANSRLLEAALRKMVKHDSVYYVPNGVDEKLFTPEVPINKDGPLVAGHVGKACKEKGQQEFIIPAIEKAGVESIYNMNDYRQRVPYCEMPKFYHEMDVFVVASVEDGTPNGALEAASCGRPIISNRIGNMPEFIEDGYNGFLVDRNVGAYVEKLRYLQNNKDKLIQMGKNARKTIMKSWTWKKQAENWRTMFKTILNMR
jgi:glycosyltransferase involved in cell wall biosynthesis